MTPQPIVDIALDADDLADRVAIWLATRIALAQRPISLNLSGGSTPKKLYELLVSDAFRTLVDWSKLHLFWGDERFVPHDHPSSNYRMTLAALLSHVPIPPEQIHPVPTDTGSPEKAAALYEQTLQNFYGAKVLDPARPLFDVTLLGLGTDGHTASLFPGTAALDEQKAWVTSIVGVKEEPRISLTYPALGSSESILFLVSGAEKKEMLKRVLDNDQTLPAARIATTGRIIIYTDAAAALD